MALTAKAQALGKVSTAHAREIYRAVAAEFGKSKGKVVVAAEAQGSDEQIAPTIEAEHTFVNYRQAVATKLLALPAAGFERFCQRLLRESGLRR